MKKKTRYLTIFAVYAALMFSFQFIPESAYCQWCPDMECTETVQCGSGCSCLITDGEEDGVCVSGEGE